MWDAYRELAEEKKLDERVFVLWHAGSTMESARQALAHLSALPKPPGSLGDGLLLSGGAKIYMDGSGGARTAWMHQPWNKNRTEVDGTNVGYPATDPEIYRQMVRMFHQAGVHVGTHAIGDRAIDWVVDTYAQVLKEKPTRGLRHSIIHCNLPTDHAITVMASLQKGIRRRLSGGAGSVYVVDRRYLRGQLRSPTLAAAGAFQDLARERRPVGRRVRLRCHALSRALRNLGLAWSARR